MNRFEVKADFAPSGDQPSAITSLSRGLEQGERFQTLLGITGSGKSATVAWTIEQAQRPALVIAPNKALAAQLANEFRQFFPDNRVEYFVSYYDYYQPEAYMPQTDTYIEKDSSINDEIDGLRHSATSGLMVRDDVVIVASVSCIYGLGSPEQYEGQLLRLIKGVEFPMSEALRRLVMLQYQRNEVSLTRGRFRVKGDTLDIFPTYQETVVRVEYFGDEVERIASLNPVTGETISELNELHVFPATHYVTPEERMAEAVRGIQQELAERLAVLEKEGKLLEAQRLRMRTNYDLEMMREIGYCSGIENYSRYLDGREPGEPPYTLLDYFPDDYITIIDESHITLPQIGGQYEGDRSRKEVLVEHGFRLPSALDNRPLRFDEWLDRTGVKVILGKGGMSADDYRDVLAPRGAVCLTTMGYGLGATYGRGIRDVLAVHWLEELGIAQAIWVLDCQSMGAFLVEGDLEGNSLFDLSNQAINERLPELYASLPQPSLKRFGETTDRKDELI